MKQSRKFAVTGGIGSGKSTVCNLIKSMGFPVFSCDDVYRELQREEEYLNGLKSIFPLAVKDGALDREYLSNVVFSDKTALKRLNEYAHPRIMERIYRLASEHEVSFAEVPLLFEGGFADNFDGVIVVMRDRFARSNAVMARDGLSEEKVEERINNQVEYEKMDLSAHTVIYNDGDLSSLKKKVEECILRILG